MKRQHASQTEITPLDEEFFEDDPSETQEEDMALRFGELEKEEEEAFEELESEIQEWKSLEEKVLGTLNPPSSPSPEFPAAEGKSIPENPESKSKTVLSCLPCACGFFSPGREPPPAARQRNSF